MEIKQVIKPLCFIFLMSILTGCWDQREIDTQAYVIAIGLDKQKSEGKLNITYLIANPEFGSLQQGGSTNEPGQEIISFPTNDFISSKKLANAIIAKEIAYELLSVFIVSEDFAKDKDFIRFMYDATKDQEIRRDNTIIVTKEIALTFIKNNKPQLETRPHKFFELILQSGAETGLIPQSKLHSYFNITEADSDLFLAAYGSSQHNEETVKKQEADRIYAGELPTKSYQNKTQLVGSALFKEGKMIDKLNEDETRIAVLLNDTLQTGNISTTFPDPFNKKYSITTTIIKKSDNRVKMKLRKGGGKIHVTIPITIDLLSNHSMINYATDRRKRERLKKFLEEELEREINEVVKKSQQIWKGEPFGWSLPARKHFQTIQSYKKFDWMKSYPNMDVNINVTVKLGKFGRQGKLPNLEQLRD